VSFNSGDFHGDSRPEKETWSFPMEIDCAR